MINPERKDRLVVTPSEHSEFNTKQVANLLHALGNPRRWVKLIWHSLLEPKIVTFLWKICRHAIPIDTRIQIRGVVMASRCRCCNNAQVESLRPLFLHSQVAREVWDNFGKIFRLPTDTFLSSMLSQVDENLYHAISV